MLDRKCTLFFSFVPPVRISYTLNFYFGFATQIIKINMHANQPFLRVNLLYLRLFYRGQSKFTLVNLKN